MQVSRTPPKCSISTNNNNTSLPTSTHLQSPNNKIAYIWDNDTGLSTNRNQKIDQTLKYLVPNTTSQHHTVDSTTKSLPSVSTIKKSKKLPVAFLSPRKPSTYSVTSLSSQQNRKLIPSDDLCPKINVSYQKKTRNKQKS